MIDRAFRKISFAAIVCITGCAQLPWNKPPAATAEQLRAQHRYVSALKVLDARKQQIPDYQQKRDDLLSEAHSYQSDILKQAYALIDKQQYAQAHALIESARGELPASKELSQFDEQFASASDRYLQRWLDELTVMRAASLVKEHASYQSLQKSATAPQDIDAIKRHQDDVDYFAPKISSMGSQALAQNDYAKAAQYLKLANQLAPSPAIAKQLKSAEQGIVAGKQKQQAARENEREQRYRDLITILQKSMQDHEFFAARDLLGQARSLNTHSDELDAMQRELDESIAAYVALQIDTGNHNYADGHIEEALENWRTANALTPTSELQDKIDKAQKFIDRLQQLQQQNH